ncbi:MAG: hypothetical protein J5857_06765 [Treponema sp.]|nr:hypothetical protein [Treponema sp.]
MNLTQTTQREYKDRLFKAIFGRNTDESKRWRLDLYNALNNTSYTDPNALELNTIENVIYITMHNDVSFLVDSQMNLYEQQSTFNPNMPLRGLMYFSQLYQIHLTRLNKSLLSSNLVKIPTPKFIVFYNGAENGENRFRMRLSDAFIREDKSGDFEWTADVININPNHNKPLQKKCNALYDYIRYVYRVEENRKSGMGKKEAVEEAVDWAIKENLLEGFFKEQKAEVIGMSLTEFDEEEFKRVCYEDGIVDGERRKALEAAENLLRLNTLSNEQISQAIGLPLEKVQEIAEKITVSL